VGQSPTCQYEIFMSRFCSVLASFACFCASGASPDFLLPNGVAPTKQTIELTIDPARNTFRGWARIAVDLQQPQPEIWLNGKDLVLEQASIDFLGKTHKTRAQAVAGEFIRLIPDRPVGPGPALLSIRYRAPLSDKAVSGPFRKQVEGRWYAFTVFTPIDARRAFPCFDEPRFKTPWEVSIHVKRVYQVFANAPQLSETEQPGGMKLVRFALTQPLPAEVVAFAVGPFDVWDGGQAGARHTPVRVITPQGHREEGKEAARATAEILPRLEKYTGLPYPWEKLDHIALPAGAFGATENPGLITFRSRGLLIAPGSEDPERLWSLRSVQAHEIGHQWFGNLVSQATWQDVWLSEGFATWLAAKMMDQDQPEARQHLSAIAARERIFALDAGPKTRPVRLTMETRGDMKSVYNQIVYQKGAAVLLMLENWLGEDRFQKGLQAYLKAHALANATTEDFVAAVAHATNTNLTPVVHSFLDQTGVPNVRATVECTSGKTPDIVIEQIDSPTQWTVPVCWRADGVEPGCTVLESARREVVLPQNSACPAWILPNAGGAGYYRTTWTAAQVAGIASVLDRLSAAERLTLLYDLAALPAKDFAQPIFRKLLSDPEPEIVHAARVALGLEVEPEPPRRR
jgi:alanyl aminopeptidase